MANTSHIKFFTLVKMIFAPLLIGLNLLSCSLSTATVATETTSKKNPGYYSETDILYTDKVYNENIQTVLLYNSNMEIAPPIIALNTDEQLTLRFDDFDGNIKTYNYSIIHCNADWTPSNLMEIEYLEGYFMGNIPIYEYSFNTLKPYIHYRVNFPDENTKIILPGNYILLVYENGDKSLPALTKRFMVYDNKMSIRHEYKATDDVEERNYKQEIDFTINTGNIVLNNGFSDLTVYQLQNYRWDNALTNFKPKFINGKELVYNVDEPQTFYGLNEFRHISITNTAIKGNRIFSVGHDSTLFNAMVYKDEKRNFKKYITNGDVNGRFKINRDNTDDEHTQADYIHVTFSLEFENPPITGDFYLFGGFTNWQIKPEYKLQYNESLGLFMRTALLKQGSYDYMYVYVDEKGKKDDVMVEGTHFSTENQYTILVYYRDIKRGADLLYGFSDFNNQGR